MKLRTETPGVTVEIDGARVDVNLLGPTAHAKLAERYTKTRWQKGRPIETVDRAALALALWSAQVTGWDAVEGPDGEPLTCDDNALALAWEHNADWCARVLEAADDADQAAREADEKKP